MDLGYSFDTLAFSLGYCLQRINNHFSIFLLLYRVIICTFLLSRIIFTADFAIPMDLQTSTFSINTSYIVSLIVYCHSDFLRYTNFFSCIFWTVIETVSELKLAAMAKSRIKSGRKRGIGVYLNNQIEHKCMYLYKFTKTSKVILLCVLKIILSKSPKSVSR